MAKILDWSRVNSQEILQQELILRGSSVIITTEFISSSSDIGCFCPDCYHTWKATPCNLIKGTRCGKCAGRIIKDVVSTQRELDNLGKDVTIIGEYKSSKTKVNFLCNICGYTWQGLVNNVKSSSFNCQGCRAIEKQATSRDNHLKLVDDLTKAGKNFTLLSDYIAHKDKIDFICNICGFKDSKIPLHLRLHGCYGCSHLKKSSLEELQTRLDAQNKQITVSGEYVNSQTHLTCKCRVCNSEWKCTPSNLRKRGCPSCAVTGFDPSKPGYLYYLRVRYENETYWKIGITNLSVRERFRKTDREKLTILYCHLFNNGADALNAERNILKLYKEYRPRGIKILQAGNTELFTKDVLQMDHLFWGPI